jgi:hypothetical protein
MEGTPYFFSPILLRMPTKKYAERTAITGDTTIKGKSDMISMPLSAQ